MKWERCVRMLEPLVCSFQIKFHLILGERELSLLNLQAVGPCMQGFTPPACRLPWDWLQTFHQSKKVVRRRRRELGSSSRCESQPPWKEDANRGSQRYDGVRKVSVASWFKRLLLMYLTWIFLSTLSVCLLYIVSLSRLSYSKSLTDSRFACFISCCNKH